MTAQANTKILVRIGQFRAATHGEASLHESHPSAHGKHSKLLALLYSDVSPQMEREKKKYKHKISIIELLIFVDCYHYDRQQCCYSHYFGMGLAVVVMVVFVVVVVETMLSKRDCGIFISSKHELFIFKNRIFDSRNNINFTKRLIFRMKLQPPGENTLTIAEFGSGGFSLFESCTVRAMMHNRP